jgi:hypothetical protein
VDLKSLAFLLMVSLAGSLLPEIVHSEEPEASLALNQASTKVPLREVIVSHTDNHGILQLYP